MSDSLARTRSKKSPKISHAYFGNDIQNTSSAIHPFLPPQMHGKGWNGCEYVISTNIYIYRREKRAQQRARAPSGASIPKWKHLPNWESSSKPIRWNPPHHTRPDTRTMAQYMQLITLNPNIYFSRPKMPPDARKSAKQ
jgi:hypothetical protein